MMKVLILSMFITAYVLAGENLPEKAKCELGQLAKSGQQQLPKIDQRTQYEVQRSLATTNGEGRELIERGGNWIKKIKKVATPRRFLGQFYQEISDVRNTGLQMLPIGNKATLSNALGALSPAALRERDMKQRTVARDLSRFYLARAMQDPESAAEIRNHFVELFRADMGLKGMVNNFRKFRVSLSNDLSYPNNVYFSRSTVAWTILGDSLEGLALGAQMLSTEQRSIVISEVQKIIRELDAQTGNSNDKKQQVIELAKRFGDGLNFRSISSESTIDKKAVARMPERAREVFDASAAAYSILGTSRASIANFKSPGQIGNSGGSQKSIGGGNHPRISDGR